MSIWGGGGHTVTSQCLENDEYVEVVGRAGTAGPFWSVEICWVETKKEKEEKPSGVAGRFLAGSNTLWRHLALGKRPRKKDGGDTEHRWWCSTGVKWAVNDEDATERVVLEWLHLPAMRKSRHTRTKPAAEEEKYWKLPTNAVSTAFVRWWRSALLKATGRPIKWMPLIDGPDTIVL